MSDRLAERIVRRTLHTYFRFARGLTLGVRGAVFDADGRIFLVRHTYVRGWYMPGGGVEVGEDVLTSLKRELAEEGNIVLTGEPRLHGMFFNGRASRRDHVLLYVVRAFEQTGPRAPDREIAETGFFAIDALPAETTPATRARLAEIIEGATIAAEW
jgi:8-oxo-dGTP pyrophosphatase MutT (NUDIX family)